MRRTSLVIATGMLGAALSAVGSPAAQAAPVDPPGWDNGPGGEKYVAFGDSFVAGPGIAPQRPGICARSEKNFPSLVAARLEATTFRDASCSGATTDHYWEPQAQGADENPPQLDALTDQTTLVTLGTMGGNDVGLVQIATSCFTGNCAGTEGDANHQAVDALAPVYRDLIAEVRDRAPQADLVAVGHGTYVPPTSCAALPGVTPEEAVYLQGLIDHLSDTIGMVAEEEGIPFADMRTIPGAADHTVCAASDQQWIRAINTYGDGAPMHPSTAGMDVMAGEVLRTIRTARGTEAALDEAADNVRVPKACKGKKKNRRAVFVVRGAGGLVDRFAVRVGRQRVGLDEARPWRIVAKRAALRPRNLGAKTTARITLQRDGVKRQVALILRTPRCLR